MISAVIIDDEQNNIEVLQNLLEQFCPEAVVVGTAIDSENGFEIISQRQPQLVFLDIEMPYSNGFSLLEKMAPVNFEVIFVTAFNQYAIRAFKYAALDYLLKPVSIEELKKAVARAKLRIAEKNVNIRIDSLLGNFKADAGMLKKIGLPALDGLVFEEIENIVHLAADGNCTHVITRDKRKTVVSKKLKEFEELLPLSFFCRIHHSHIINLNFIKKYYKGRGGFVEMLDGTKIEVSARKRDEFLEKFKG